MTKHSGAVPLELILAAILAWARTRPEIRAIALAGSYARGAARLDSDIDLLLLTTDPELFRGDWLHEVEWPAGRPSKTRDADYGIVRSRHISFTAHPELEVTFAPLGWASINPIDPGTRGIITNGFRILHDPDNHLTALQRAIQKN